MFGRLWRQRRLIVLNCIAAYLACVLNPGLLEPLRQIAPAAAITPLTFTGLVFAVSLLVGHLAPSWRWMVFALVFGYGAGEWLSRALMPQMAGALPEWLFRLDEEGSPAGPGPAIVIVLTLLAATLLRMIGGLLNTIPRRGARETVVGGAIRRPRAELWALMAPQATRQHWNPEVQMVDRDRGDPKLSHVIYWRKFGLDHARRVRRIAELIPGQQFREEIVDDARSTLTRGQSGGVGWLLEDHPKGTFLTMRETVSGLGLMTPIWRWFDDFEKDYLVFLRAHLEGGRDWSLYGLDIVTGEHPEELV